MNCLVSYSRRSMLRNFFSQIPVSSALLSSSSLMRLMSSTPVAVATSALRTFLMYRRRKRVSMMAARVEGRPMPFSLSASRSSSLSTVFPAVSMARSKEASV